MTTCYLFLDTETGGLDPVETSLLSLSCLLTTKDGEEIVAQSWFLKPYDSIYKVTPAAMAINKIDLTDQEDVVNYYQCYEQLAVFLRAAKSEYIIPVGWNLPFDLNFLYEHIVARQDFQKLCNSYKMIDLASVWLYLKAIGKVDSKRDRLIDAANYFELDTDGVHDSAFDTKLTKDVFYRLKDIL